jgi:hypothetical protein
MQPVACVIGLDPGMAITPITKLEDHEQARIRGRRCEQFCARGERARVAVTLHRRVSHGLAAGDADNFHRRLMRGNITAGQFKRTGARFASYVKAFTDLDDPVSRAACERFPDHITSPAWSIPAQKG